jgi:charged multivesicular body protein 3
MKLVNNLMKAPEVAVTMQEFSKEMTKVLPGLFQMFLCSFVIPVPILASWLLWCVQAGVMEEMVNDAVDSALDNEDMEEEIDEEVDKVLSAIAGETASQLPETAQKQKEKVTQPSTSEPVEVT